MYRDCFMLCFYLIGINISDLLFLPKTALKNGRISYKRNKTGKLYDIKVEPEAMEIISRHKSRKRTIFSVSWRRLERLLQTPSPTT